MHYVHIHGDHVALLHAAEAIIVTGRSSGCPRVAVVFFFFFQAEDGIRDLTVTGVQTCALPISASGSPGLPWGATTRSPSSARPPAWHPETRSRCTGRRRRASGSGATTAS